MVGPYDTRTELSPQGSPAAGSDAYQGFGDCCQGIHPATLGVFLPSAARRPREPTRFVSGLRSEDRGPRGHVLVRVPVLMMVPDLHPCPLRPPTASSRNTPARGGFPDDTPQPLLPRPHPGAVSALLFFQGF